MYNVGEHFVIMGKENQCQRFDLRKLELILKFQRFFLPLHFYDSL